MGSPFGNFVKADNKIDTLLMFLLLNNSDLSEVDCVEWRADGRELWATTNEYIDEKAIQKEIGQTVSPSVFQRQSLETFNMYENDYTNEQFIYEYLAQHEDNELRINDLDVISRYMIIERDWVVSNNEAKSLIDSDNLGFMSFCDYFLDNRCKIDKWDISYTPVQNKKGWLEVTYMMSGTEDGKEEPVTIFKTYTEKPMTYQLVIYIIKKAYLSVKKMGADNFRYEKWKKK